MSQGTPEPRTRPNERRGAGRVALALTRVWLPVAIAVVGIVGIVVGGGKDDIDAGAGVALVIAALIVWMINWMYRMSVQSNRERETEEAARDYYDLHGRWPDE
jgi:ABC-type transport system involved in cytochrome bd biosynthesis fused ATPase/permease subunit